MKNTNGSVRRVGWSNFKQQGKIRLNGKDQNDQTLRVKLRIQFDVPFYN